MRLITNSSRISLSESFRRVRRGGDEESLFSANLMPQRDSSPAAAGSE